MGVELDENGTPIHLKGGLPAEQGVKIVFASADSVPNTSITNHTVNHIDISISGKSEITVPLAYGTYYYRGQDGQMHEYIVNNNVSLKLEKNDVNITAEDMKHATIKAYDVNGNEINDAFVIKGYSSNAQNAYSTVQVRIEGDFKVSTTTVQPGLFEDQNSERIKNERYNNRITYNVSAIKELEFPLEEKQYGYGQLYEKLPNGEYKPMSVTVDVNMGANFSFWDEDNACPATKDSVMGPGTNGIWQHGGIPNTLIGMDFELGGDAEEAGSKIVAVEITKLIVDENGQRIKPAESQHIVNSFDLYQDADGNPNSVVGLDIDTYTTPANYNGYDHLHSKDVKVGPDGIGLVYDYAVTPGMLYIQEKQDSIPENILDSNGETWHYAGTRIETESPWRDTPDYDGHMHVSDTYVKSNDTLFNSIPEVLGNYNDIHGNTTWYNQETGKNEEIRNGFLEFFVYNIYEPEKTEVKVKKEWENGTAPDGASVDVVLKRYKLVKNGSITPPEPTTGSLTINDSYSGLSGDRIYNASYRVTGPNEYDQTFTWTGDSIIVPDLVFGNYTVTKTATSQDGYDAENLTEEQTVSLGVSCASVTFTSSSYTRQNSEDKYYRVRVYANDYTNVAESDRPYTWVDEVYPEGTYLMFTVGVPGWNNNSTYEYSVNGGERIAIPIGETKTESITVNDNITIIIYGTTPYYNQWLSPAPSVSVASDSRGMRMLSAKNRSGILGATSGTEYNLINEGSNPEIEGYTWQEDTTWYDGNGLIVHLPYEGNWEKTVSDLEKEDPYGNVYVYYIYSVKENGMPSGMDAKIILDGENKKLVYGDHSSEGEPPHKNDTLDILNTFATGTTITIAKVEKDTLKPLTGASFSIQKYTDNTYQNTDGEPITRTVDVNGKLEIKDLLPGFYKLKETEPPPGYIKISNDPTFEVRKNQSTQAIEVIFTNTDMVTYQNGTFTVQDEPGTSLPNTGGPGTSLLYLAGMMLIMMVGTGLMMSKRQRRNH